MTTRGRFTQTCDTHSLNTLKKRRQEATTRAAVSGRGGQSGYAAGYQPHLSRWRSAFFNLHSPSCCQRRGPRRDASLLSPTDLSYSAVSLAPTRTRTRALSTSQAALNELYKAGQAQVRWDECPARTLWQQQQQHLAPHRRRKGELDELDGSARPSWPICIACCTARCTARRVDLAASWPARHDGRRASGQCEHRFDQGSSALPRCNHPCPLSAVRVPHRATLRRWPLRDVGGVRCRSIHGRGRRCRRSVGDFGPPS